MASGHGMKSFQDRVTKLEQRHRPRPPGLSFEGRKHLTDRAVAGDQEALQELNLYRQRITQASPQQRAAALAAALRADNDPSPEDGLRSPAYGRAGWPTLASDARLVPWTGRVG